MINTRLDNKGFTLAEVLIVIAIVVILAAVAIPSVMALQRNLLMDEANGGANAIATAAQTQMTAKKADGTWAALVRNDNGDYKNEFPQATGAANSHMRYMEAQTARDQGIITDMGVEQQVRDANYIIEFDGLTASVTRVFFTNAATGFMGTHLPNGQAAVLNYYKAAPDKDNAENRRMYEGCAIGLYEGTPDGATPGVALVAPSVSANEYGKMVLTNPNLYDAEGSNARIKNLTTEVEFSYPVSASKTYSFTISGMTKNFGGDTYTVTATDGANTYTCQFSNAPSSKTSIYTVESNMRYEVDLNDLSSVLEDHPDKGQAQQVWDIVKTIQDKSRHEMKSKLKAVCTVKADDCLPVAGRAFLDWPSKVPTLKVYVTDPDPSSVDAESVGLDKDSAVIPEFISGKYESPQVNLVDKNGQPVDQSILNSYTGLISDQDLKASYALKGAWVKDTNGNATKLPVSSTWFNIFQNENVQEGSQTYSGKTIKIDQANTIDANVAVTVGSYTSNSGSYMSFSNNNGGTIGYDGKVRTGAWNGCQWPTDANAEQIFWFTGAKHDYQIFEVWLDDGASNHRVGYFKGTEWQWDDDILRDCVKALDANGNATSQITEDTTRLLVDSNALMSKAGELSKYQNYSLYVRTAPKSNEALGWFNQHIYTFGGYVGSTSNTTDQRGQNYGRPIRWLLENEFGSSTTVAAWTISTGSSATVVGETMRDQAGQSYPKGSDRYRVYYSALPAVAWDTSSALDSRYLDLPNAQLMLYSVDQSKKSVERMTFANGRNTMYSHVVNGQNYQIQATGSADLAMLPKMDHLFYHVLVYFDEDGTTRFDTAEVPEQYTIAPLDGVGNDVRFPEAPAKNGKSFVGWKMTAQSGTVMVYRNDDGTMPKLSQYMDRMKTGAVSLTAKYREGADPRVGLIYLDNYDKGDAKGFHYSGFLNADTDFVDDKAVDANTVSASSGNFESGYYLSYHVGTGSAPEVDVNRSKSFWGGKLTVAQKASVQANLGGKRYAFYKVTFNESADTQVYTTVRAVMKDADFASKGFYCNSVFGGMVADSDDVAVTFGREAYPWRVYNTNSFPGLVQSKLQDVSLPYTRKLLENNSTLANSTNQYRQMRNLNFEGTDTASLKQWPVAFAGTYDGRDFAIFHAEKAFTTAPLSGGTQPGQVGTVYFRDTVKPVSYSNGLFPIVVGRDRNRPAIIKNLNVEVGDCSSDAQMFAPVAAYSCQCVFNNLTVKGTVPGQVAGQPQAHITLNGMGRNGTTDAFCASGAISGRVAYGISTTDCHAENLSFDYKDSTLELGNGRNVFGGLYGVFDFGGASSAQWAADRATDLTVSNISFNFADSVKAGKSGALSCGGIMGRLYISGAANYQNLNWEVRKVAMNNDSQIASKAFYPGIVAGTYGGTVRCYDGLIGSSDVTYTAGGNTANLIAVFLSKRTVNAAGLISGSEWYLISNAKNADDLLKLYAALAGAPATMSEMAEGPSMASVPSDSPEAAADDPAASGGESATDDPAASPQATDPSTGSSATEPDSSASGGEPAADSVDASAAGEGGDGA